MVWWVILCVNLFGSSDAQIFGYTLFWGMSLRVFLDEISIWVGRLSKADFSPQYVWASSNPLRARLEQKYGEGEFVFSARLLELDISLLLPSQTETPLALWFSELHHQRSWVFSWWQQIMELSVHNHMSQFLTINIFTYTYMNIHYAI